MGCRLLGGSLVLVKGTFFISSLYLIFFLDFVMMRFNWWIQNIWQLYWFAFNRSVSRIG